MSVEDRNICSLVEGCSRPETSGGGCLKHKFENGVRVNGLALFAHDRKHGLTQAQKAREMFQTSKDDKVDIMAVRGRKSATQKYNNGAWEKA